MIAAITFTLDFSGSTLLFFLSSPSNKLARHLFALQFRQCYCIHVHMYSAKFMMFCDGKKKTCWIAIVSWFAEKCLSNWNGILNGELFNGQRKIIVVYSLCNVSFHTGFKTAVFALFTDIHHFLFVFCFFNFAKHFFPQFKSTFTTKPSKLCTIQRSNYFPHFLFHQIPAYNVELVYTLLELLSRYDMAFIVQFSTVIVHANNNMKCTLNKMQSIRSKQINHTTRRKNNVENVTTIGIDSQWTTKSRKIAVKTNGNGSAA